jgi:hypothetical protein
MRVKDQANVTTIMAIVLLVSFMLPWLKVGGLMSFEGYELPVKAEEAGFFSLETLRGGVNYKAYMAYILYLIPIASAIIIVQQIRDKAVTLWSFIAGGIPLLVAAMLLYKHGMGAFDRFQIGIYISVLAGVLMILDSSGMIKIPGLSTRRR